MATDLKKLKIQFENALKQDVAARKKIDSIGSMYKDGAKSLDKLTSSVKSQKRNLKDM
jgi:hypothetical protein